MGLRNVGFDERTLLNRTLAENTRKRGDFLREGTHEQDSTLIHVVVCTNETPSMLDTDRS